MATTIKRSATFPRHDGIEAVWERGAGMFETITSVWAALGLLGATAATVAGAAYLLFRYLGDKWLTAKFNERLESYRHEQQRQLEQMKLKISTMLDRTVKLHQHEFDVLPEIWSRLNGAFGYVASFVSPMQNHADLDNMSPAHLEDFLSKSDIADFQKDELRRIEDKTSRHMKIRFWYDLNEAYNKFYDFNNYFVTKSIFLDSDLKRTIEELRDILSEALLEKKLEEQYPSPRPGRFEKSEKVRSEGRARLSEVGTAIQQRLWSARTLEMTGL